MPRYSDYVEAPYQGVSQAAAQIRLPTQAETMDGTWAAIPTGLTKHPPFEWVTTLLGLDTDNIHEAYIKRSYGEFLLVIAKDADDDITPRLYDLGDPSGTPLTVTVDPDAQAYLEAGNPEPPVDYRSLTVEDYTFILNRKVTVENVASIAPARPFEGMLWVRQAAYARTYEVTVRHGPGKATVTTVSLTTPNGKDATDGKDVDTDVIAGGLYGNSYPIGSTSAANGAVRTGTLAALSGSGFTVTLEGGVISLSHPTNDFDLDVKDGQGGAGLLAVKDKVQTFSDLPKRGPSPGFTVRLTQQTSSDADDFYVRWEETAGGATGIWTETIAPGANLGADPETLPIALIYDQNAGTWSLDVLAWGGRTVGDETLSPDPGFIGTQLKDITFWKERVTLLYAEGARCSSTANVLLIYPSTLSSVIASDAFEVGNPLDGQAFFEYAVPFKRALVLWGQNGQAQVTVAGDVLTPDTAVTVAYSAYEFAPGVKPQASNDRIYFAAPRGESATAIYEMEVSRASVQENAEGDDMSVSVPRYIPPFLNKATSAPVNYASAYGRSGYPDLLLHLYRYSERERVQNAWQKWPLPEDCTLAGMYFDNTRLNVLAFRGGEMHLLRADTADGITDEGSELLVKVNFKVADAFLDKVYDAGSDTTEVTFPYILHGDPILVVTAPGGVGGFSTEEDGLLDAPEGTLPEILEWTGATVTLQGDWTQAPLIGGEEYSGSTQLSTIYARDPEGKPNRGGKLKLRKLILDLDRTALLRVIVQAGRRAPKTYTFEASKFDTANADYDKVSLYSGPWSVPVGADSEEVKITFEFDRWAPAHILGYTWFGEFNPTSSRGL